MEYISGIDRGQMVLFPDSLDEYISKDNPVRVIDAYVDSIDMKTLGFAKTEPNETGRPMYAPQDILKLYLYGYMNRLRSSRRLETESHRNVELMWLLKKLTPDHKTIARFRHDNAVALKNVFREFVKLCMKLELYGKELVAIDGSKFRAVNSKNNNFNEEKLKTLIARIDASLEKYLCEFEESDNNDSDVSDSTSSEIKEIIVELKKRKCNYQAMSEKLKENGETQISTTDGDSRRMMNNGKSEVCYNIQTAVDSKHCLIADFDVTNDANDKKQLSPMSKKAKEMLEVDQLTVVADKGYDSATQINECLENDIMPHIAGLADGIQFCMQNPIGNLPKTYENGRCVYLSDRNIAVCPMGMILYPSYYRKNKRCAVFANYKACSGCTQKCTIEKYKRFELIMKQDEFSKEFDVEGLQIKQISYECDKEIVKKRKTIVEHPFGILKRIFSADHCLTKGLNSVRGEFSLAFLALNMKRVINILGTKRLIQAICGA